MRVFRRRSAGATDGTAQDSPGARSPDAPADNKTSDNKAGRSPAEAAKGRPTPKRSVAEAKRRQPITGSRAPAAPRTPEDKAKARTSRATKYDAMKRGEAWALNPRDRGPTRALARDFIDSKRRISEYYMYGLGVLVVLLFLPATRLFVDWVVLVVVIIMLCEGTYLGRQIQKLAAQQYPGEPTRGVKFYAGLRAMQIRRLRMPAPRVKPGDKLPSRG